MAVQEEQTAVKTALMRMVSGKLHQGFHTWYVKTIQVQEQAKTIQTALMRFVFSKLHHAMMIWHTKAMSLCEQEDRIHSSLLFVRKQQRAAALNEWHRKAMQLCERENNIDHAASRYVHRKKKACLTKWKAKSDENTQAMSNEAYAVIVRTLKPFHTWHTYTANLARVQRTVYLHTMTGVARCYNTWLEFRRALHSGWHKLSQATFRNRTIMITTAFVRWMNFRRLRNAVFNVNDQRGVRGYSMYRWSRGWTAWKSLAKKKLEDLAKIHQSRQFQLFVAYHTAFSHWHSYTTYLRDIIPPSRLKPQSVQEKIKIAMRMINAPLADAYIFWKDRAVIAGRKRQFTERCDGKDTSAFIFMRLPVTGVESNMLRVPFHRMRFLMACSSDAEQAGLVAVSHLTHKNFMHWQRNAQNSVEKQEIMITARHSGREWVLTQTFATWLQNANTIIMQTRILQRCVVRMKKLGISAAFDRWFENAMAMIEQEAILHRCVLRMTNMVITAAFEKWFENAMTMIEQRFILQRCAVRMRNMTISAAFHKWYDVAIASQDEGLSMLSVVEQHEYKAKHNTLYTWLMNAVTMKEQKATLRQCVLRLRNCQILSAFDQWYLVAITVEEQKRNFHSGVTCLKNTLRRWYLVAWNEYAWKMKEQEAVLLRCALRIRNMAIYVSFHMWLENALTMIEQKEMLRRCALRLQNMHLSAALVKWYECCVAIQAREEVADGALAQHATELQRRTLLTWHRNVWVMTEHREILNRVLIRMKNMATNAAFDKWYENAMTMIEQELILRRCVVRLMNLYSSSAFDRWRRKAEALGEEQVAEMAVRRFFSVKSLLHWRWQATERVERQRRCDAAMARIEWVVSKRWFDMWRGISLHRSEQDKVIAPMVQRQRLRSYAIMHAMMIDMKAETQRYIRHSGLLRRADVRWQMREGKRVLQVWLAQTARDHKRRALVHLHRLNWFLQTWRQAHAVEAKREEKQTRKAILFSNDRYLTECLFALVRNDLGTRQDRRSMHAAVCFLISQHDNRLTTAFNTMRRVYLAEQLILHVVIKMRGLHLTEAFNTWHRTRRHRHLIRQARVSLHARILTKAFQNWMVVAAHHEKLNEVVSKIRASGMARDYPRAWNKWKSGARRLKEFRDSMAEAHLHIQGRLLVTAWRSWGRSYSLESEDRSLVAQSVQKLSSLLTHRAWNGWREWTDHRRDQEEVMDHCVQTMHQLSFGRTVGDAFDCWRETRLERIQVMVIESYAVHAILAMATSKAWRLWRAETKLRAAYEEQMELAAREYASQKLTDAMASFRAYRSHGTVVDMMDKCGDQLSRYLQLKRGLLYWSTYVHLTRRRKEELGPRATRSTDDAKKHKSGHGDVAPLLTLTQPALDL